MPNTYDELIQLARTHTTSEKKRHDSIAAVAERQGDTKLANIKEIVG